MKPYRLINSLELQALQDRIDGVLRQWNDSYGINPLSHVIPSVARDLRNAALYLNQEIPRYARDDVEMTSAFFGNEDRIFAFFANDYLQPIQHALFGKNAACFNACTEELFLHLLNQLFQTTNCSIQSTSFTPQEWFYAGSTCLLLHLHCEDLSTVLVLNPDWVHEQLPQIQSDGSSLCSLDKALEDEAITLHLELLPIKLPLEQIASLQTGDVLSCDQTVHQAFRLMHLQQVIAEVHLAQTKDFKSIQLKRTL